MDRDEFKKRLEEGLARPPISNFERACILNRAIAMEPERSQRRGDLPLIIAMEECAELQKEISKAYRGKVDRNGLIEEIADVLISIEMLKHIFYIPDIEIRAAVDVKTDVIAEHIREMIKQAEKEETSNGET